jgi:hypothetical protein
MTTFTLVHILISLVGIGSGFVVLIGMLSGKGLHRSTALFLGTTVATSVTGFGFPAAHVLPSHVVGVLSLLVLAAAIVARYPMHMAGRWRTVYVVGALIALYFNVFVLIVQSFLKVSALKALAPTQSEPPFLITQSVALIFFAAVTILAVLRFRDERVVSAAGVFVRT